MNTANDSQKSVLDNAKTAARTASESHLMRLKKRKAKVQRKWKVDQSKYRCLIDEVKVASIQSSRINKFRRRTKNRQRDLDSQKTNVPVDLDSQKINVPADGTSDSFCDKVSDSSHVTSSSLSVQVDAEDSNTQVSSGIEKLTDCNSVEGYVRESSPCRSTSENSPLAGWSKRKSKNIDFKCSFTKKFFEDRLAQLGYSIDTSENEVNVLLTPSGGITLRGVFIMKVLSGEIVINGYKCTPGIQLKIVCPTNGLHLTITGCGNQNSSLKMYPLEDASVVSMCKGICSYPHFRHLFRFSHFLETDANELPEERKSEVQLRTERIQVPYIFNNDAPVAHDEVIMNAIQSVYDAGVRKLCVCGSKNVGKSTTNLFILNALLSDLLGKGCPFEKVYWLECDVGQPEFTLPGCVSLLEISDPVFGSHFCHMRTPLKSYFVGSVSIADVVDSYLNAIEKLVNHLESLDSNVPVLVNMPGWIDIGLGLEITSNILRTVQPSKVIQYKLEDVQKIVELDIDIINECDDLRLRRSYSQQKSALKPCSYDLEVIPISKAYTQRYQIRAANERNLRILAHFHQTIFELPSNIDASNLLNFPRKKMSFLGKVLEVMPMNRTINPKLILLALNMTVVAFCKLEENAKFNEPTPVHNDSFYVSSRECQMENQRVVIGFGIITGKLLVCLTKIVDKYFGSNRLITKFSCIMCGNYNIIFGL